MAVIRLLNGSFQDDAVGEIINKFSTDSPEMTVICPVRKAAYYPILAPDWTDLRLGFFLSLTDETADDTTTGLAETIAAATDPDDRYWIGIKNGDRDIFPRFTEEGGDTVTFIGFTNSKPEDGATESVDDSVLSSSDKGVGTTNTNFWRPHNSTQNFHSAMIIDGETVRDASETGLQQHFPQNVGGAGGYSVFLGLQLLRDAPDDLHIRSTFKTGTLSGDWFFSSVPTKELVRDAIKVWPNVVQTLDSVTDMTEAPNAFYFYWPFSNSRLRIHALGVLQAS